MWAYAGRAALGCTLLAIALKAAKPTLSHEHVNWALIAAGAALTPVIVASRAWRWNLILRDYGFAYDGRLLARVYGATMFLGLLSPGRVGELSRVVLLRERGASVAVGLYSVTLDRLFDAIPTFAIAALFLATLSASRPTSGALASVCFVASLLTLLAICLARPRLWLALTRPLARRCRLADEGAQLERLAPRPLTLAPVVVVSIMSQIVCLGQAALFAAGSGITLGPAAAYGLVSVVTAVVALPISLGGIGTREATLVYLLGLLHVSQSTALVFSFVLFANFAATSLLCLIALTMCPLHVRSVLPSMLRGAGGATVRAS